MWFKNIHLYRLTQPFTLNETELVEALEGHRFSQLATQESDPSGWISPINRHMEHLTHVANQCYLLCMRTEQKVIPASMIKERVEDRVHEIEAAESRRVYGKEKANLKDDIIAVLTPNALTKSSHVWGYIDTKNNWLVVNAGSHSMADSFVKLLIDSLGSLSAVALMGEVSPAAIMNDWVSDELPQDWSFTGQFDLKDPKDDRVVKIKDTELEPNLARELIEDGYWIQKLGFEYKEQFSAQLQHDLQIKSIKYHDKLVAENEDIESDDPLARLDADFVLMSQTISSFAQDLVQLFEVNTERA